MESFTNLAHNYNCRNCLVESCIDANCEAKNFYCDCCGKKINFTNYMKDSINIYCMECWEEEHESE